MVSVDQFLWYADVAGFLLAGKWPVGVASANPEVGGQRGIRRIQWFRGLRDDLQRKTPLYSTDWLDALRAGNRGKSLAAVSFLYFACLAPVLAFGGAMATLTGGAMGVAEVILSSGLCGMAYAMLSGQVRAPPCRRCLAAQRQVAAWASHR